MAYARRDYKDSLFKHLFGSERYKANALELYNALAGTHHDDPEEVEITTLDDFIFLGRKNDVSFLISDELVLFEQQSTHNPNMPLRGLLYFSRIYGKIIERRKLDIYGTTLVRLPAPRYFVLYFGDSDRPDCEIMKLSNAFAAGPSDLEVTVTVLNCNEGKNEAIMEACETLRGYAHLLALVRVNAKADMGLREAVEQAVDQCIEDGYLVDYLETHRMEVSELLFTIADEERAMRVHMEAIEKEAAEAAAAKGRAEGMAKGMAEGLAEGRAEGRAEGLAEGMAKGVVKGAAQATLQHLQSIMASTGCDEASALKILGLTGEDVAEYKRLLAE